MSSFDARKYRSDRDATILAYARTERGGADKCDCAGCRNFRLVRAEVFPAEFIALLDKLGIDPAKDAEVYHNARLAPGRHDYGGWYHFVGTLDQNGEVPPVDLGSNFTVWMGHDAGAPRLPSLKGCRLCRWIFILMPCRGGWMSPKWNSCGTIESRLSFEMQPDPQGGWPLMLYVGDAFDYMLIAARAQ
jgi:hypothetical protein